MKKKSAFLVVPLFLFFAAAPFSVSAMPCLPAWVHNQPSADIQLVSCWLSKRAPTNSEEEQTADTATQIPLCIHRSVIEQEVDKIIQSLREEIQKEAGKPGNASILDGLRHRLIRSYIAMFKSRGVRILGDKEVCPSKA